MKRAPALGFGLAALLLGAATASAQNGLHEDATAEPLVELQGRFVPEEYVVEEGDTLWDICDFFFEDPWRWPTVWALNPHVTNPHWIYPGDVLRLRYADGSIPAPSDQPLGYTISANVASQVSLNEGFITEKKMDRAGTIRHSTEEKVYLAAGDPIYMELKDLENARIGQQYSIYRKLGDVIHPRTEEKVGAKIEIRGIAEIDRVDEKVATGHIVRSFHEIERGDRLTPLLNHYQVVSPRQNLIDLEGIVVDSFREVRELGQFHIAFIDKGGKDGVQVGNRLFVLRREDGRYELEDEKLERLPWEQVGELLVVETQDRNSTVLITRSIKELRVGDRVQMQRHY